jgi:hypothetical protein
MMVDHLKAVCRRAPTTEASTPLDDAAVNLAQVRRDGNCQSL